jgi:hypothetical protein
MAKKNIPQAPPPPPAPPTNLEYNAYIRIVNDTPQLRKFSNDINPQQPSADIFDSPSVSNTGDTDSAAANVSIKDALEQRFQNKRMPKSSTDNSSNTAVNPTKRINSMITEKTLSAFNQRQQEMSKKLPPPMPRLDESLLLPSEHKSDANLSRTLSTRPKPAYRPLRGTGIVLFIVSYILFL